MQRDGSSVRILSDLRRLGEARSDRYRVTHRFFGGDESLWSSLRLFFQSMAYDAVVLNSNTRRLLSYCLFRWLLPVSRCHVVALDIHLVRPETWKDRAVAQLRRLLLRQVDHFILYFNDLGGYERYFGVSPARALFVPFKVNSWDTIPPADQLSSDGEYILMAGRSLRDLPTFIAAMRRVPHPALLVYQDAAAMRSHGTHLDLRDLPPNVRAERHDGNDATWLEFFRRAKLVVVPTLPSSIYAPGLSVYLLAMAFKKCVIVSEGPQTRGLLTDEAIIVPAGDPTSLAGAIQRAWEDDGLRERTAAAGRRYAECVGGEERLLADIVNLCGDLVTARQREHSTAKAAAHRPSETA